MQYGFHVLEQSVVDEKGVYLSERKISIIHFLQMIEMKHLEKYEDYVILGLEDLLAEIESEEEVIAYLNGLLREHGNYFYNKQNIFFFVIERGDIEIWDDRPLLKLRGGREVNLQDIFGAIVSYEDDPNWFWQQLNISS
jgi:hypothetical protein